jgi:hypothetical protein
MTEQTMPEAMSPEEGASRILEALIAAFPLNAVRLVSDDEIAIEDDRGDDWIVRIEAP